MEDTFDYLQLCNQNRSVIDGLSRTDYWDYPKDAIREALINAIGSLNEPTQAITPQMQKMLDCISKNPDITDEELQGTLGVKQSRLYTLANQMKTSGLITVTGRGESKKYLVEK